MNLLTLSSVILVQFVSTLSLLTESRDNLHFLPGARISQLVFPSPLYPGLQAHLYDP